MKTELTHITDYLAHNAREFPDKPAFIFGSSSLTWLELYDAVVRAAARLPLAADHQRIVGVLLPNSLDFIISYLAIIHAGHIAMPMDPNFKQLEIDSLLSQMSPDCSITDAERAQYFPSSHTVVSAAELTALDGTTSPSPTSDKTVKTAKTELSQPRELLRLPPEEQVVSLLFTSGTTGTPKCTPYTHNNHLWNVKAVAELWQWTEHDTLLLSLPLSHWHGLSMGITGALLHANTVYIQERFSPEATLEMLASGTISLFMHVPIAYLLITQFKTDTKYDLSKVRLCISGSSYLPPRVWQDFKDLYGHDILERYGASEMGILTSNRLDERIPGSVGYPLPGVEIRIESGGEIVMKSPGLFPGYYKNEAATAEKRTADGFWLSGDIGDVDATGRLVLKGRVQEKMKKYGYTVYPRDVEWALLKNTTIDDAFVMSQQNAGADGMSDLFVYFVVGAATEAEIIEYCKANMPNYWRPDKIIKLDEIPKSPAGKPKLAKLRDMVDQLNA